MHEPDRSTSIARLVSWVEVKDRQHRAPGAPAEPERRQQPPEPPARLANGHAAAAAPAAAGHVRHHGLLLLPRLFPSAIAGQEVHGKGPPDRLLLKLPVLLGEEEPARAPMAHPSGDAPLEVVFFVPVPGRGGRQGRGGGGDDGPAERAADVVVEPCVDAVDVERVGAGRQQLEPLPGRELGQANGAGWSRRPPRRCGASSGRRGGSS